MSSVMVFFSSSRRSIRSMVALSWSLENLVAGDSCVSELCPMLGSCICCALGSIFGNAVNTGFSEGPGGPVDKDVGQMGPGDFDALDAVFPLFLVVEDEAVG